MNPITSTTIDNIQNTLVQPANTITRKDLVDKFYALGMISKRTFDNLYTNEDNNEFLFKGSLVTHHFDLLLKDYNKYASKPINLMSLDDMKVIDRISNGIGHTLPLNVPELHLVQPRIDLLPLNLLPLLVDEEDSIWRKLLACIPAIGIIFSVVNEKSLKDKITNANTPERVVELIKIKNHYKIASIVRSILTVVLAVSVLALGFFSVGLSVTAGIGITAFKGSCAVYYSYSLHKNRQLIEELEAVNSIPDTMTVY